MENININDVSIATLKSWLALLNLPTEGTKTELMARLNKVPVDIRDDAAKELEVQRNKEQTIEAQNELQNIMQQQRDEIANGAEMLKLMRLEIEASRKFLEEFQVTVNRNSHIGGSDGGEQESEVGDLLQLEDGHTEERPRSTDGNAGAADYTGTDGNAGAADHAGAVGNAGAAGRIDESGNAVGGNLNNCIQTGAMMLAKEILLEFTGESEVRKWVMQFFNVAKIYRLNDRQQHLLCISKLKGGALKWLHADPMRIIAPIDEMLNQLVLAFGGGFSKSELRQKFEDRVWKPDEVFATYFSEKSILAQDINIDVEELMEGIIRGIPCENLRTQASMHCFTNPAQILRAFAAIKLPIKRVRNHVVKQTAQEAQADKQQRCYNCNVKGHWAKDCLKPKREAGSCYACGSKDHLIAGCPNKKMPYRLWQPYFIFKGKVCAIKSKAYARCKFVCRFK
ncbi:uncharacterized protein [Drosophila virilis]|uniref:uncharacterized protein isoform X1 n=1 Tax=Drosophila virilis TaxID=7244 RepID=UPI0038B2A2A3